MNYVLYDTTSGEIMLSGVIPQSLATGLTAPTGQSVLLTEEPVDPDSHYVDPITEALVPYSAAGRGRKRGKASTYGFRWSPAIEDWIDERPIEHARSDLLRHLKRERDRRIEAGFVWDGSAFDSDAAISQPRLLGLFTSATAGGIPPEGYPWRLADNSWRVLSSTDAIAVWGAFQAHLAGHFAAFAVHEAAALAATDVEVLRGYDLAAGWPG